MTAPTLVRHLRLPQAVALAVTIVIGSGALVLPGIAYQHAGTAAVWAWVGASVMVLPLLVVFARLGAAHPTAGGAAGFVQAAFGRRLAGGVEILLMGTFGLGIPAIALTGGHYLAALGLFPDTAAWAGAVAMLAVAAALNVVGVRLSARVQTVLAIVLTAALLAAGLTGLGASDGPVRLPEMTGDAMIAGVGAIGVVFFAFTGWEMLAFTAEEYRNPRRDFPLAVAISFVLVVGVYLVLALGVQSSLSPTDPRLDSAPVQAMVTDTVDPVAGRLIATTGVVIIMANLIGALWGASRLVMSSAREGLLPARLARVSPAGTPAPAVLVCAGGFVLVVAASSLGLLPLATLLSVAGGNFFLLYLLSVAAYLRLFPRARERVFATVLLVAFTGVAATFGLWPLLYAAALLGLGTLLTRRSDRRGS